MQSARILATWSGNSNYTLTTSYVASDPINVDNNKRFSLYIYYTPASNYNEGIGVNNTLYWYLEESPYTDREDPTNVKWNPVGEYLYLNNTASASPTIFYLDNPNASILGASTLTFNQLNTKRIRLQVKEQRNSQDGVANFIIVKTDL